MPPGVSLPASEWNRVPWAVSLPASQARVWAALPAAFTAIGLSGGPVEQGPPFHYGAALDRARGTVAGEPATRSFGCGTTPSGVARAATNHLEVRVVASVEPVDSVSSRLHVRVRADAIEPAGRTRAECASTGRIEGRLRDALTAALAPR